MIVAKAVITNPDDAKLRLTVEMTVGEWKRIRARMSDNWPEWQFASMVDQAVSKTVDSVGMVIEDIKV